ncbi:MAG TPA: Ig-like domain-containing protein [Gemmatimonadaceae bacterium]
MVYVSLPSGSIPNGVTATISVRARPADVGVTATMLDGGFDPVPVDAVAGDMLDVTVKIAGESNAERYALTVPALARPIIIRTSPPPKKRDVPLNASLLIVFSEPIDVTTVSEASVHLLHGAMVVRGKLAFTDASNISLTFTPDEPLSLATDYELRVTQSVRDLDGQALETPVSVSFTTAETTIPQVAGTIAFTRITIHLERDPNWGADLMWARDGFVARSERGEVTQPLEQPAWSPDGAWLALNVVYGVVADDGTGGPEFRSDIYLMSASSGAERPTWRRLTTDSMSRAPSWSPDGRRLVFVSGRPSDSHIVVMDLGTGATSRVSQRAGHYSTPRWSPAGTRLAFTDTRNWNSEIYVVNVDGSSLTPVAHHPAHDYSPSWSPDGKLIAFDSERESFDGHQGYASDIFTVDMTTGALERLTITRTGDWAGNATWSPDGRQIAYSFVTYADGWNPDGRSGIYVTNRDGSPPWRVTAPPFGSGDTSPTWKR